MVDLGTRLHGAGSAWGMGPRMREDTEGRGETAVRFFDAALMCSKWKWVASIAGKGGAGQDGGWVPAFARTRKGGDSWRGGRGRSSFGNGRMSQRGGEGMGPRMREEREGREFFMGGG